MQFCCRLIHQQRGRGGRSLFAQPWSAPSWEEGCVQALLALPGMQVVRCDLCVFGQMAVAPDGRVGPAQKAVGFITDDPHLARALDMGCHGGHDHVHPLNSPARGSERYPPRLVAVVLRALKAIDESCRKRRS